MEDLGNVLQPVRWPDLDMCERLYHSIATAHMLKLSLTGDDVQGGLRLKMDALTSLQLNAGLIPEVPTVSTNRERKDKLYLQYQKSKKRAVAR